MSEEINNININMNADVKMDFSSVENALDTCAALKKAFSKPLNSELITSVNNIKEAISKTIAPIMSEIMSERFRIMAQNLAKTISFAIEKIPQIEPSPEMLQFIRRASYLMYVKDQNWPLFLIMEDEFVDEIIKVKDLVSYKTINEVVFDYIDEQYVDSLYDSWIKVENINKERIPLLKEAIELYKNGYYFGTTSILMCQIDGIAEDIFGANIPEDNDEEIIAKIQRVYRNAHITNRESSLTIRKIKGREKLQLLWASGSVENGVLLWQIIANYIFESVYASGNNADYDNPCRNKICHGEQMNYGTKEHALKSILVIDLLYNLMYEHNCIKKIDDSAQ